MPSRPDDLAGRRALVTAGTRGIGRAVAQELIARGAQLAISGTGETTDTIARELGAVGAVRADFTRPGDGTAAAAAAAEQLGGPLDLLIVNTGGPRPAPFAELTDADWTQAYHLILGSAIELTRACLPGMTQNGWGRIVYLASTAGVVKPLPHLHLSNVMRAGIRGLSQTVALEAGPAGVTANLIATGPIDTGRHDQILERQAQASERTVAQVAASETATIPVRRIGTTTEMAALVAWLCSDDAAFITGTDHVIDGGLTLT
jgi:3-oxoacyl-[acyl-carrier protein] reductase